MATYNLKHLDYAGDLRSFEFEATAGDKKATVGRREYEEIRDYSNAKNIVGRTIKETESLSGEFVSTQTEVEPFLAEMDSFMQKRGLIYDADKLNDDLTKHIIKHNKYQDNWLQLARFDNTHSHIFNFMSYELEFFAMGKVFNPDKKNNPFKTKLATEEINDFQQNLNALSEEQVQACAQFYDLISQLSSKERKAIWSSFRDADKILDTLNKGSKNLTADPQAVEPYKRYFAHIHSLIKKHENDIREEEKNNVYDSPTIAGNKRAIKELECEFIAHVIADKNPKTDKNLIQEIVSKYELVEYDSHNAKRELDKQNNNEYKEGIQFDDLLQALKIDATKDRMKFDFYKRTGNIEVFMDQAEAAKFKTMSADDAVAAYGNTVLSQYKSAVLIMEAIKRDKKQGKDVVPALNSLADAMGYFNQTEKEFHPDGIRQFMFDNLIKDYNKFKPQGYKEVLELLAQVNNNTHEVHPQRKKILDDKEKMCKQAIIQKKVEVKARLSQRAQELQNGDVRSGTVVADMAATEITQRRSEGYEVNNPDKIINRFKNKPLNKIQQEVIKKYGSKNK